MELIMKVNMDNAAFADDPTGETVRIMKVATEFLEGGCHPCRNKNLFDINGNKVGFVEVIR
jgi:hypothetical protein